MFQGGKGQVDKRGVGGGGRECWGGGGREKRIWAWMIRRATRDCGWWMSLPLSTHSTARRQAAGCGRHGWAGRAASSSSSSSSSSSPPPARPCLLISRPQDSLFEMRMRPLQCESAAADPPCRVVVVPPSNSPTHRQGERRTLPLPPPRRPTPLANTTPLSATDPAPAIPSSPRAPLRPRPTLYPFPRHTLSPSPRHPHPPPSTPCTAAPPASKTSGTRPTRRPTSG